MPIPDRAAACDGVESVWVKIKRERKKRLWGRLVIGGGGWIVVVGLLRYIGVVAVVVAAVEEVVGG